MTAQWKGGLESKFGLTFDIIDRDASRLRRLRSFSVNPWTTGSRFILSHSLLAEEDYVAGLRDVLGRFRSRALFILDERIMPRRPAGRVMRSPASLRGPCVNCPRALSTACS